MARMTRQGAEAIYAAAERLRTQALAQGKSLFDEHARVWAPQTFSELRERFVDSPDVSKRSFDDKLADQLANSSPEAIQLMAELLYVHLLVTMKIGGARKRELVSTVLDWSPSTVEVPTELLATLDHGLVNPGTWFNTRRDTQLSWLITFGERWSQLEEPERERHLDDPWELKAFAESIGLEHGYQQMAALLHLLHPDVFEGMVSRDHKQLIAERFADLVTEPSDDLDRRLLQIRQRLNERYGTEINFYESPVVERWRSATGRWSEFVDWAGRFYRGHDFDEAERQYKLDAAADLNDVVAAVQEGRTDDLLGHIKRALTSSRHNLTAWQTNDRFLAWARDNGEELASALEQLWASGAVDPVRLRDFLAVVPRTAFSGTGARVSVASFLLSALDPTGLPVYRAELFKRAFELTDATADPGGDEATTYLHALDFLDTFIEEAAARGLELRDRLDAQGLVWMITKYGPPPWWDEQDQRRFRQWRGDPVDTDAGDLNKLAGDLLLDVAFLEQTLELLDAKGQVIFHGPPGTGKTYVAQRLAEYLAGGDGDYTVVQFHPSYAYEDFVEGFRPDAEGGSGFTLRPGPLKRITEQARANPEARYVLVIDELNRGNVAKVFGELYFLLEYRDHELRLQYSDTPFRLPANLSIIATMNTADRSIALVDAALRRRFYFIGYFPDEWPIDGLLRAWLHQHRPEMLWVADLLDRANAKLGERHAAIGPSHFMRENLDDRWVQRIWNHAVLPYIEEQLWGEEQRLSEFALDRLTAGHGDAPPDPH